MEAKTQTAARSGSAAGRAAHDGESRGQRTELPGPGIDLPFVGHVEYKSAGFMIGLGVAGVVGAIEWPVVAAVGIGYALARQGQR